MNLLIKTQTQQHILKLEEYAKTINSLVSAAILNLNESHRYLWSLPDNELTSVLQDLLDIGKLEKLFIDHHYAATSLKKIQDNSDFGGQRAISVAGREFTIDNGVITLIQPPQTVAENILPSPDNMIES